MTWNPEEILLQLEAFDTSTGVARVSTRDGHAFLKTPCSDMGADALVRELVATIIGRAFGLPIPNWALFEIDRDELDIEIYTGAKRRYAKDGIGFGSQSVGSMSRGVSVMEWAGDDATLKQTTNLDIVSRLVVFDTWVRNWDRYSKWNGHAHSNSQNLLIEMKATPRKDKPETRLIPIDHTHSMHCPDLRLAALDESISDLDNIQDEMIFGLFPAFVSHIKQVYIEECCADLRYFSRAVIQDAISKIPSSWGVADKVKCNVETFLFERSRWLADNIAGLLRPYCWSGSLFDNRPKGGKKK